MVIAVSSNTLAALQNARTRGIVTRDFVWFKARNRVTGALETIGICSEAVAVTVQVLRPNDGVVVSRTYQPGAGLMTIPSIPSSLKLEERRIRLEFSGLSAAVYNAVKVYDIKDEPVEIHRALYDPATMNAVDPAHVRFDGFARRVTGRQPTAGLDGKLKNNGKLIVEITDHSASLKPNPVKISKAFFEDRDGDRGGDHINANPRLVWGQEVKVREKKRQLRVRLLK